MKNKIHSNAYKSSNLLRFSALLCFIDYFFFEDHKFYYVTIAIFVTIFLLICAAYLIRKGNNWVRWVLLILFIPGLLLSIIAIPIAFKSGLIQGCLAIVQDIIQGAAFILLFIPYKIPEDESEEIEGFELNSIPPTD